ncbi:hypothetical protein M405DRAFT_822350 [Rhizopogon salebrosus TDB-379]|nr:hypothetical protein M405DRAFT_822350 [Rhizopogon salebrosus TDB-379]
MVNEADVACSLSMTLPLLLLFFTKILPCTLMSYSTSYMHVMARIYTFPHPF